MATIYVVTYSWKDGHTWRPGRPAAFESQDDAQAVTDEMHARNAALQSAGHAPHYRDIQCTHVAVKGK